MNSSGWRSSDVVESSEQFEREVCGLSDFPSHPCLIFFPGSSGFRRRPQCRSLLDGQTLQQKKNIMQHSTSIPLIQRQVSRVRSSFSFSYLRTRLGAVLRRQLHFPLPTSPLPIPLRQPHCNLDKTRPERRLCEFTGFPSPRSYPQSKQKRRL